MSSGQNKGYDGVPEQFADEKEHRRHLARAVNRINGGKFDCTVDATLRASQTSTTLSDPRIGATSHLMAMPLSASAQAAQGSIWYSNPMKGQITVNHASSAEVDQNFRFAILG